MFLAIYDYIWVLKKFTSLSILLANKLFTTNCNAYTMTFWKLLAMLLLISKVA